MTQIREVGNQHAGSREEQKKVAVNEKSIMLDVGNDKSQPKNIEPFQILPIEIIIDIMLLLPQDVRANCLRVSRLWRNQMLACPEIWHVLSFNDEEKDMTFLPLASYLGDHVKKLSILSTSKAVQSKYIEEIRNGHYKEICSLKLSESASHHLVGSNTLELETYNIFSSWQIKNILTHLEIDTGYNKQPHMIFIADILIAFRNLKDLIFGTTDISPQTEKLNKVTLSPHQHLAGLNLKADYILERDVERIAQLCPRLRRLVMSKCSEFILNTFVRLQSGDGSLCALPDLEMFAFNPDEDYPPLPILPPPTTPKNNIEQLDRNKGLRIIYTNNGGSSAPIGKLLPIIYNNRHTLETVFLCAASTLTPYSDEENAKYQDFKLERIKNLTFWVGPGIDDVVLQSIRGSKTLKCLELVAMEGLDDQVVELLLGMPQLRHLEFISTTAMLPQDTNNFIRLFSNYAQLSSDGRNNQSSLQTIAFQDCQGVITDQILEALSNIKSLEEIWLGGPYINASIENIHQFITKVGSQNLKGICLHDIKSITDTTIGVVLGEIVNQLYWIKLKKLDQITDNGLRVLVNKKKNRSSLSIGLVIEKCPLITLEGIDYARKKVKTVIHNVRYCSAYQLSLFKKHRY